MATLALHGHIQLIATGHEGSFTKTDVANSKFGSDVLAKDPIGQARTERILIQQERSTAGYLLFSGLENQLNSAAPLLPQFMEHQACTEHHGSVRIVSACMHNAGVRATIVTGILLVDRQRVDVRAQGDDPIALSGFTNEGSDDACACNTIPEGDTGFLKTARNECHGTPLLKAQFRLRMQMPAQPHQFRLQPGHGLLNAIDHLPKMSFSAATIIITPNTFFTMSAGMAKAILLPMNPPMMNAPAMMPTALKSNGCTLW